MRPAPTPDFAPRAFHGGQVLPVPVRAAGEGRAPAATRR